MNAFGVRGRTAAKLLRRRSARTRCANPDLKKWHLVMDCLNIHQSESSVRWIAQEENIPGITIGKKGQSGILQSMKTRVMFFSNPKHKIVFHYTPKQCS